MKILGLLWLIRGKESACSAGDPGLILRSGRSLGEGNGYPFQYYCLENSTHRAAWWVTIHEVTFLMAQVVKNLPHCRRCGFIHLVGKITWRRKRKPTPVFLPGDFHGSRSLAGYSPCSHKESDITEHTSMK